MKPAEDKRTGKGNKGKGRMIELEKQPGRKRAARPERELLERRDVEYMDGPDLLDGEEQPEERHLYPLRTVE